LRTADARHDPDANFGLRKAGPFAGQNNVAVHGQLGATAVKVQQMLDRVGFK
jgi:hypothetical protein